MNRLVLSAIIFMLTNNAMAILPSAIQPNEFPMLPAYCKAKLSSDPLDDKAYSGMIGPDWRHIHHYCFALNFTNRFYKTSNPNDKRHYINSALNNHDYVLTHAAPDFWMRPEIHTEKAKQLKAAKRYAEALGELKKALHIKPDSVIAYVVLADVYLDLNKKTDAVAAVEEGLQHGPENRTLQRRYKTLVGKDFVPPLATPVIGRDGLQNNPPSDTDAKPTEVNASEPVSERALPQSSTPSTPSEIGSPTNPYCRFCP
ncbi:MAG: tetratricopeptide repeat protein [Thiobacillus sp.]|nr:tetratricopeptide repeat protein [Thiobacillus sp.]